MRPTLARYLLFAICPFVLLIIANLTRATEQLFLDNCAACHQRDGKGIPKVYPSLAASEVVRGSAVDVALVLLVGRGEMPSFKGALSSADMASIINYVRNSWGNSGEAISADRIEELQ